jgi:hypothetical protein
MKHNIGLFDRVLRFALGIILGYSFFTHAVTGVLAIVFAVLALVLLTTSVLGFCPLYALLHISTGGHHRSSEG